MNRGFKTLMRSLKRQVAALFAPAEHKPRGSSLFRRTMIVTSLGLFVGAAALSMVQQPDRTALKFSRISSTIGMRVHPIHKTWTEHKGVDYAASAGTPIHATADSTVEFASWQNGYGNVVVVKHFGKYSTFYIHQSRISSGITKGTKVSQSQLLGYVGSTGGATGMHLNYELRIDNKLVDPLSVDLPIAQTLEPAQLRAFEIVSAPHRDQIQFLTEFQQAVPDTVANR